MTNNLVHDFKIAFIKHKIEEQFYERTGKILGKTNYSVVTGPDYERHINNAEKYLDLSSSPHIYEINTDIFIDIYSHYKSTKVKVFNKSIETAKSRFIDCDLTCISDGDTIFNTLLNQIKHLSSSANQTKAFIFSMSPRSKNNTDIISIYRRVFGLLGNGVVKFGKKKSIIIQDKHHYMISIPIYMTKGRILYYESYLYNTGGGPMYTCLIIYK